jgi:hypothetical protein
LLTVIWKPSFVFFGLLAVPAFLGLTVALNVASGSRAMAPAATAGEVDATTAPVSSLRNLESPLEVNTGVKARTDGRNTPRAESFAGARPRRSPLPRIA